MDKLAIFKTKKNALRDYYRLSRSYRQAEFEDAFLKKGEKVPFKHSWSLLAHMHDLRVWTLCYAPSQHNNLQRMQEIHMLNNEMWYMVNRSLWKRLIVMVILYFYVTRFAKSKWLNEGAKDS